MIQSITFKTNQFLLKSEEEGFVYKEVLFTDLKSIESSFNYVGDKTLYKIDTEIISNEYFWMSIDYGSPTPHREVLINIETFNEDINPRKENQVELTSQSFFLYSFKNKLLYASNSRHLNLFISVLKSQTNKNFQINKVYINSDEFMSKIKNVKKISFSAFDDLFFSNTKEYNAIIDLTGTSCPKKFTLIANYDNHSITNFLKGLFTKRKNSSISELMISGFDSDGFEMLYNTDTFSNKIPLRIKKNNEGVYDMEEIKNNLLDKIKHD